MRADRRPMDSPSRGKALVDHDADRRITEVIPAAAADALR
jgi:hypothetical protein